MIPTTTEWEPSRQGPATEKEISAAARILRNGGIVAFPTETVYGLGGNALDENAVARIFDLKARPRFDPLIVHLADAKDLDGLVSAVSASARTLMSAFWPGPLTVVLPKRPEVPDLVTAGRPTVAVRVPGHPLARKLIRKSGIPIAAPSANRFGRTSPTTAAHVRRSFPDGLDAVLDGGPCRVGVESTVLTFDQDGVPRLLRAGGVAVEDLESLVGAIRRTARPDDVSASPGMLQRHYAPHTPLFLNAVDSVPQGERWGWMGTGLPTDPDQYAVVESLGDPADLRQAAARLFSAMHRLDSIELKGIHARPVPEIGLGRAINDRLRRASEDSTPD